MIMSRISGLSFLPHTEFNLFHNFRTHADVVFCTDMGYCGKTIQLFLTLQSLHYTDNTYAILTCSANYKRGKIALA
jgi:hypothetical protein